MNKDSLKWIGIAAAIGGLVLSQLSDFIGKKQTEEYIKEQVDQEVTRRLATE